MNEELLIMLNDIKETVKRLEEILKKIEEKIENRSSYYVNTKDYYPIEIKTYKVKE